MNNKEEQMFKKIILVLSVLFLCLASIPNFANDSYAATKKAKPKCSGVTSVSKSVSWAGSVTITMKTNSCDTEKVIEVLDDASSAAGATAGILAVIPGAREIGSTSLGVAAGVLWINKFAIKKISNDGTYGMRYTIKYNPLTPAIPPIFFYWKQ